MPFFELAFMEVAPEMFGAEALGTAAELGTAALTAGELAGLGAEAFGVGAAGAEGAGITQAAMAADAAAGGAGAGSAGINAAQVGAQQATAQGLAAVPEAMSPAQQAYQAASTASATPGMAPGTTPLPAYNNAFPTTQSFPVSGFESAPLPQGLADPALATQPPMGMEGQLPGNQFIEPGSGGVNSLQNSIAQANIPVTPPSALESGMNTAIKFAKENPFTAMMGANLAAQKLGLFSPSGATFNNAPYDGPLSKYKLSPNFKASNVNPADFQYRPRYAMGGGIMSNGPQSITVGGSEGGIAENAPGYASGGSLSDSIASYQKMLGGQQQSAPAASRDVGIYYDQDPDTRYQDALTAAQIRQAKVNQRAYVSSPVAKRPTPMGKLNMPTSAKSKDSGSGDVEAYEGGIMQSSLGGYAAGGNPRLLKGPGDGMSDNIPATINGRQPARLADGEFVIPADVVSHLGNGSTEAGAKQLHAMMNKVRSARTGNSKQGKEINPKKYMPK